MDFANNFKRVHYLSAFQRFIEVYFSCGDLPKLNEDLSDLEPKVKLREWLDQIGSRMVVEVVCPF